MGLFETVSNLVGKWGKRKLTEDESGDSSKKVHMHNLKLN